MGGSSMNDTMKTRLDQLTNTCDCVHELLVEVQRVSVDIARVLLHAFPVFFDASHP